MKAGVMLADFTPSGIAQPGLFDEIQPRKNSEKLMKTLDERKRQRSTVLTLIYW
ncbi:type VI secretion protein ImpB [Escherichia coli]|nr:type VI secretion protein ImpB [Escherichia coli]